MFKVQDAPKTIPEVDNTPIPQPKKDCAICNGKGFVDINGLGIMKAQCTCRYK